MNPRVGIESPQKSPQTLGNQLNVGGRAPLKGKTKKKKSG